MKKSLLTLTFILAAVFVFAQASVAIGIKAGPNFANADVDNINSDGITSFHGGAYGLIKLANIGIQPEILWSRQGSDLGGGFGEVNTDYVNIPVMVKFYLPLGLNLQGGPQFGMLLNAEDDAGDADDRFKNSDLSAALGAGWDAPFGLQFSARYILGLSDVSDGDGTAEYRNRMFQLSIGYSLFKLGK